MAKNCSFARSMILHSARAAGIAAIDTVYSDVENTEGFRSRSPFDQNN